MSTDRKQRLERFMKVMEPAVVAEDASYNQIPVGSRVWNPCAGIQKLGKEKGHLGEVTTYLGNRQWQSGEWISRQKADEEKIAITDSSGICPECQAYYAKLRSGSH